MAKTPGYDEKHARFIWVESLLRKMGRSSGSGTERAVSLENDRVSGDNTGALKLREATSAVLEYDVDNFCHEFKNEPVGSKQPRTTKSDNMGPWLRQQATSGGFRYQRSNFLHAGFVQRSVPQQQRSVAQQQQKPGFFSRLFSWGRRNQQTAKLERKISPDVAQLSYRGRKNQQTVNLEKKISPDYAQKKQNNNPDSKDNVHLHLREGALNRQGDFSKSEPEDTAPKKQNNNTDNKDNVHLLQREASRSEFYLEYSMCEPFDEASETEEYGDKSYPEDTAPKKPNTNMAPTSDN
eukprot:CAMPEP_0114520348 /NCGR_PEP_ID=MMETSP0109-20121206/19526_1 /TAXON_ID=29199 /ORGANISM="Chlorarachnion reptans, Strain CCCM449" /LENGTH=293 /DNA_ID=CAMNT_0001701223 /DNA_START=209 /DNA_END=1090 /DNA_ORIENTATION=-